MKNYEKIPKVLYCVRCGRLCIQSDWIRPTKADLIYLRRKDGIQNTKCPDCIKASTHRSKI